MFYYKKGGTYVASIVEIPTAEAISMGEYDRIKTIIDNRPTAPDGFAYRLTENLEWELYELPVFDEITDTEALNILLGGAV